MTIATSTKLHINWVNTLFFACLHIGALFAFMPYRNVIGWLGTGALFMSVATLFWRDTLTRLSRTQLWIPLLIYLVNFAFGAIITISQLDSQFWIPTIMSVLLGVVPAVALWWAASPIPLSSSPTVGVRSEVWRTDAGLISTKLNQHDSLL